MGRWRIRPILNALGALLVAGGLLFVGANGLDRLPPLGAAFNPGTGVWSVAADARLPQAGALHLAGLDRPAHVTFEANGTAHIAAASDHDLFLTLGYLHARFRLFQMDVMRREGEGLLAEVFGQQALSSDAFRDQIGLTRTAQAEWNAMAARKGPAWAALTAYAAGVNDCIDEDENSNNLPLMFKLIGYRPAHWQPVDTLVVQGDMTETLDFNLTPLDNALLSKALGRHYKDWFPVLPPNDQRPYVLGPYGHHALEPLPSQQNISAANPHMIAARGPARRQRSREESISAANLRAIAAAERGIAALPRLAIRPGENSNNWAVDGAKTLSGKPLLAGDPHLHQTLPAIWYQVAADAPGYHFSGVSIPGTPIVLIGHNGHISWSETNTSNQATLFYLEQTDKKHPGQYYWNGAWRRMTRVTYSIPVKGHGSVSFDVDLTVHGPLLPADSYPGGRVAIDWMGALPSDDMDSMLGILRASSFAAFRDALRGWHAPSQNFVYADDRGNIGLIGAGYYPIVKSGDPSLPLPGTGEADVVGTIPFADIPQIYNPPNHVVFSANQRPVGNDYPYYIGTTNDSFANGYRANRIYDVLQRGSRLTAADMEKLQADTHDYLAGLIVPRLLAALRGQSLTERERAVQSLLQAWDGDMAAGSAAASIWWTFWTQYLHDTFQPWWDYYHVPAGKYTSLAIDATQAALDDDLEAWTLRDPANAAFSPPGGAKRTAPAVMAQAFKRAVATLTHHLGSDPHGWRWDRLHARTFDSLLGIPSLSYGPRPSGGDLWTVNAASGDPAVSSSGPSWRFVMDWGSRTGVGVYPGGQSENPLSPWYENEVSAWWDGRYYPMLADTAARAQPGSIAWTLTP